MFNSIDMTQAAIRKQKLKFVCLNSQTKTQVLASTARTRNQTFLCVVLPEDKKNISEYLCECLRNNLAFTNHTALT